MTAFPSRTVDTVHGDDPSSLGVSSELGRIVRSGGDGSQIVSGGSGDDRLYGHSAADLTPGAGTILSTVVADADGGAVYFGSTGSDPDFGYALNKTDGVIHRIDLQTGARTTFLDVPDNQFLSAGEQGVLSFAFHPDYAENGRFFVYLVNSDGDLQINEYARGAGSPPTADAVPVQTVITIPHPTYANHNGGTLNFGPDGYLYLATGDGGGGGDPGNDAQNLSNLLGKVLRLDVDGDDFPGDPARNYAIPPDNPFVGAAGADEIWAYGLRNPFRTSFDRETGDFYLGDVGQGRQEEIDYLPAGAAGGANFGWSYREGSIPGPLPPDGTADFVDPIYSYGRDLGRSVTGGQVYRGPGDGLQGAYMFADFGSGRLFTLVANGSERVEAFDRTDQVVGVPLSQIVSFGEDAAGRLYAVSIRGEIYRLTPGATAGDGDDTLRGGAGDDDLVGGVGDDVLVGGADEDTMRGGLGDDVFLVDEASDVVIENAGEGLDQIRTAVSYALSVRQEIERLSTDDHDGTAAVRLTGNGLDNVVVGNAGDNVIDGGGGADRLLGGLGDDLYVVDDAADLVVEIEDGGSDRVRALVDYELRRGQEVETLSSLDSAGAVRLVGNEFANVVSGNMADNLIGGGEGIDRLRGGGGADDFLFDAAAGLANRDFVLDFSHDADTIVLDRSAYGALPLGELSEAAFRDLRADRMTRDADDRILYDSRSGAIFYDADGSGSRFTAQTFAVLHDRPAGIDHTDFLIVA